MSKFYKKLEKVEMNSIMYTKGEIKMNFIEEMLCKLSESTDFVVRIAVAENPKTPELILKKLLKDENEIVRSTALKNPSIPQEEIIKALEDKENYDKIKYSLAKNPSTPIYILEQLAKAEEAMLRINLTENPALSEELREKIKEELTEQVLENIRKDGKECQMRYYVLSEAVLPEETQQELSKYNDPYIKMGLLCNKSTSKQVLEELMQYEFDYYYCREMLLNPSIPKQMLEKIVEKHLKTGFGPRDEIMLGMVAANKSTPAEILEKLAVLDSFVINEGIAENPNASEEMIYKISKCKGCEIPLALNSATPLKILDDIFKNRNQRVKAYLLQNPKFVASKNKLENIK